MATYVIGYDLHPKRGETYTNLIKAIESYGNYWHCLDSTWLVQTPQSATQVRDFLWKHMSADDQLLVVKASGAPNHQAAWQGFTGTCQSWLQNHNFN